MCPNVLANKDCDERQSLFFTCSRIRWKLIYRVTQKVSDLGWVDLELGSSPGRWAGTMVTYCPSRMVEHLKSKST